jgi:hypothetical protein
MSGDQTGFARRAFLKGAGAAVVAGQRLWAHPFSGAAAGGSSAAVSFDARTLLVHGKRELLIAGEMHYARSTRAMWPALLDRSKELGLNGIAAYVFWNFHETSRDVYDFSGDRDLGHFLALCGERGLQVFLRSGPYCCAEWNFGGFPPYLRDEPGITMRTMNTPYLKRVEKFFERLAVEVNPHLATRGGPVILVQVENEYANVAARYGAEGQQYLEWMAALARRVGFADVPTTMCEGASEGPIATLNGGDISPQRIKDFRAKNNHDPLLWTELYPAWYEIWGETRPEDRNRDPRVLALAILVFLANGGAGWNYYMWHGGTNFARTSMYLQTTSYDFHAPLDEYGRATFKGVYLSHLHKTLLAHEEYLMKGERTATVTPEGAQRTSWKLNGRELVLILHYPPNANIGTAHAVSAQIIDPEGKTVFDSEDLHQRMETEWKPEPWSRVEIAPPQWHAWREPMPAGRSREVIRAEQPTEQLLLTKDHTDYCWYSTTIDVASAGTQDLLIPYGGDYFYVYLDGKLAGESVAPLKEDRGPITPEDPAHPRVFMNGHTPHYDGYRHAFSLADVAPGKHRLDILATAVGMIKGDWMIDSPMNFERKGIWEGVQLNGAPLKGWEMIPFLAGEKAGVVESASIAWSSPETALETAHRLCWYKSAFHLSPETLAEDADFRLNAQGLGKGMLFLNGHGVGRHWLIASPGTDGKPTQQYYHLPKNWLRAENTLIVFEEQAVTPSQVQIERRSA